MILKQKSGERVGKLVEEATGNKNGEDVRSMDNDLIVPSASGLFSPSFTVPDSYVFN